MEGEELWQQNRDVAEAEDVIYGSRESEEIDNLRSKIANMEREEKSVLPLREPPRFAREGQSDIVMEEAGGFSEREGTSVYVGNVDYGATLEELKTHFKSCGEIVRVTIVADKWTGHPKGFAYIEFLERAGAEKALELLASVFRGRELKIVPKRTNIPGYGRFMYMRPPLGGGFGYRGAPGPRTYRGGRPRRRFQPGRFS